MKKKIPPAVRNKPLPTTDERWEEIKKKLPNKPIDSHKWLEREKELNR